MGACASKAAPSAADVVETALKEHERKEAVLAATIDGLVDDCEDLAVHLTDAASTRGNIGALYAVGRELGCGAYSSVRIGVDKMSGSNVRCENRDLSHASMPETCDAPCLSRATIILLFALRLRLRR